MKKLKAHKTFDGETQFWSHSSEMTKTEMKYSTFIPEGEIKSCMIWLSGLTCTDENFITKAGAQKFLSEHKMMVICPDTSPRGLTLPGEHDSYDFGSGAGFYVDAAKEPYNTNYKMYSYINSELYSIINNHFGVKNISISGHSMGGHGALVIGLREPQKYKAISAFSPIVNPSVTPWGTKALAGYLGDNKELWKNYDACELMASGKKHQKEILIHQGLNDEFLANQLMPENLEKVAGLNNQKLKVVRAEGYDHSYYFISTFIEEHIKHHSLQMI